jgi:hypothetical protein
MKVADFLGKFGYNLFTLRDSLLSRRKLSFRVFVFTDDSGRNSALKPSAAISCAPWKFIAPTAISPAIREAAGNYAPKVHDKRLRCLLALRLEGRSRIKNEVIAKRRPFEAIYRRACRSRLSC